MVRRYDSSRITKTERTPQGYLKVTAPITRAGIFEYRRGDGSISRELRSPEQVFHGDSIKSFDGAPLVNTDQSFPNVPAGHTPLLDASNTGAHAKGMVMAPIRADDHLEATILVTDAATIADIEGGKRELSCGYACDMVMEPGEWQGQRFDAYQENIVGNHVALVRRGRAGSSVAIRLDSADAELVASDFTEAVPRDLMKTKKLKFDAAEVEVEESLAALIETERARTDAALTAAKADTSKQVARGDAAEADAKKVREELAALPEKVRGEIREELALHGRAKQVLGAETSLDGKTPAAVREAVLTKLGVKFDGKDPVYVTARFDAEMERFEAGKTEKTVETVKADSFDDLQKSINEMNAASRDAYKGKA